MSLPQPSERTAALVTGASAGIGADFARALAARGYTVAAVARRRDRLDELAREIAAAHGTRVEAIVRDLGDATERDALAADIEALGLTIEILVNNAGFGSGAPFIRLERERELQMLRLNCEAVVDLCARYAPEMVSRGRGAILNVASTTAFQPLPGQSTYAASKALVLSFTEALHQELRGSGTAVTALCPGPVRTEFASVAGMGNIESATPDFLWASSEKVVQAALDGLEANQRVVVPGAINELGAIVGRHAPRGLFLRAAKRFYPVGRT